MKKLVTLFTMVTFIVFSLSCYSIKKEKVRTVIDREGKDIKVVGVQKTSGEIIKFPKKQPGRIYQDRIIGTAKGKIVEVEIDKANIKDTLRNNKGKILGITTKQGKTYHVISAREENNKIIITTASYETIIPLSDVTMIMFKKLDAIRTFLLGVGSIAAAIGIYFGILYIASSIGGH